MEALERRLVISPVISFGEAMEGLHAGPFLSNMKELREYWRASREWSFAKRLSELGFDRWPLSLPLHVRTHIDAVARSIVKIEMEKRQPATFCVLVHSLRPLRLWTRLLHGPVPSEELDEELCWSKGLLRALREEVPIGGQGAWIVTARVPCGEIEELESVSGKGETRERALATLKGEAVERFASWQSSQGGAVSSGGHSGPGEGDAFSLHRFHPFGPEFADYLRSGAPALPMIPARIEGTSEVAWVPECLVPFPSLSKHGERPTRGTTCGLAAFFTREGAVLRGALEILERDDFYPNFLRMMPGSRVRFSFPEIDGYRFWMVSYPGRSRLPIFHAFVLDERSGWLGRGSGSGSSFLQAGRKALDEAMQILRQHREARRRGGALDPAYEEWGRPKVVTKVIDYLDAMPMQDLPAFETISERRLLDLVLEELRGSERRLLVVDLPCPVKGWHVVRVLVPGLACHVHPSESEGGKRLSERRFAHGVPC